MGAFDDYSTPSPRAAYSADYFSSLNFQHTLDLELPVILSPSRISKWTFSPDISSSGASVVIIPGEEIPHIDDLQPILNQWAVQFSLGARSVNITFVSDDSVEGVTKIFHFSKIRLFVNINNHAKAIKHAQNITRHFMEDNCLSPSLLLRFLQQKITAPISGFRITAFPLAELGCLLHEEWLEEDLANALLELLYFRLAAKSSTGTCPFLILPTLFLTQARLLFQKNPRKFSKNMLGLRDRISKGNIQGISSLLCYSNHYSAYQLQGSELQYGDSLHFPPAQDVLPILQWLVKDANIRQPLDLYPLHVLSGRIELQSQDSGSCGVASINFIEQGVDKLHPLWSDILSPLFRQKALQDLVVYHLTSQDVSLVTDPERWVQRLSDIQVDPQPEDDRRLGIYQYDDFNLYSPTNQHPIHSFMEIIEAQVSHPLAYLPPAKPDPSCDLYYNVEDPTESLTLLPSATITLEDLPSFKLTKLESLSSSPSTPKHAAPQILDLTLESPFSLDSSPLYGQKKALLSPSPVFPTPQHQFKPNFIDLTLSSPLQPLTNTVLPRDKPVVKKLQMKVEVKPEIHDLTLSSPAHSPVRPKHKPATGISPTGAVPPQLTLGTEFATIGDAQAAVYNHEANLGHVWRMGQTKKENGIVIKHTLRCNHYSRPKETHSLNVDPADHRQGRSVRTDCTAHVNVRRTSDGAWRITLTNWDHNHPPEIPLGGTIRRKPTDAQRSVVAEFANAGNFSRDQLRRILKSRFPEHELEPRQISNLLDEARREAREAVQALGGDVTAIIESLREKSSKEHGWKYNIKLDDKQTVIGVWWQSPEQGDLLRRFADILINDDSYGRNLYGYPLDIGIVIDDFGKSRNVWYSFHKSETIEMHTWVLQLHLEHAGTPPEVVASDRHPSLIAVMKEIMPLTLHIFCLHHLTGNVDLRLRPLLGHEWQNFNNDFWATYRAVSPEEFDRLWKCLISRYPSARTYLEEELYPCREQWAWTWISHTFTAGVRTNGRVESENRINKAIGGPKKTLFNVFNGLNERTKEQSTSNKIRMRELSRHHHTTNLESLFARPLAIIRKYAGPYAVHTCYGQMKESLYYNTEVVQRPPGLRKWNDWVVPKTEPEDSFTWNENEETHMINDFANDNARISKRWMHRLVVGQGLRIDHVLRIVHKSSNAFHYLLILNDKRYICDCCMNSSTGIPCRHYFQAWTTVKGLPFHLALIRQRWYQNPSIDLTTIPAVTQSHEIQAQALKLSKETLNSCAVSNPLDRKSGQTPTPTTQTIGARQVYHTVQSAIRPYLAGIQTEEQVTTFVNRIAALEEEDMERARQNKIHDPQVIKHKGRPRTARITGPLEGKARGGGPSIRPLVPAKRPLPDIPEDDDDENRDLSMASQRKRARTYHCGWCGAAGHNRARCPQKGT